MVLFYQAHQVRLGLRHYSVGFLGIASAAEAFAQFAPNAVVRCLVGDHELRFAFATEAFLPWLHGAIARSDGHGAKLDAAAT